MNDFRRDGIRSAFIPKPECERTSWLRNGLTGLVTFLLCSVVFESVPHASDQHVLSEILSDSTIGENVLALRKQLADRSPEDRFRILSDWVLPGRSHRHFRLEGTFTPTNSATPSMWDGVLSVEEPLVVEGRAASRVQNGGNLVAPAFDLVDVAKQIGHLDELRGRTAQIEPDNAADERSRLGLLFLIDLASDDAASATASMTQLFDLCRASSHSFVSERWPETLALTRGVQHSTRLKIVSELLYLTYEKFVNDLHGWRRAGNEVWDNYFFALLGIHRLRESDEAALGELASPPDLQYWGPLSCFNARTRGKGLPRASWKRDGQTVSSVSGHAQDYLMLRSPLQGNFEIEAEVSSSAWQTTELLVAGRWLAPYWNRAAIVIGNVRFQRPNIPLEPPMSRFDEWARYRVVVRDGVYTVFYNGRKLHEETIADSFDPWVAIRSEARCLGSVRNVRITGNPIVPEAVNLAAQKALPGWISYDEGDVSANGDWWQESQDGSFAIVGSLKLEAAGSFNERLLYYHRPILEDGSIEYEFYYEPGRTLVHPALDRLTFLLDPAGVDIHLVTDGKFDRTGLDPANHLTEADNRRGSGDLPLKVQDWNRLRITLRGDTIFLELNDEPIYERQLEATNQRTFGLFHYADQTEARVRNIVWRGNWPKKIPQLDDQELFIPDHECLDGLDSLTEVFSHKFTDELPEGQFEVTGAIGGEVISRHPDGLRIVPPVRQQWTGTKVNCLRPIYGDFDVMLRYSDLKMNLSSNGSSDQMLLATDESGVTLRCTRSQTGDDRSYASAVMTLPLPDGTRRYITTKLSDEAGEGTLRLVRRGSTVHSLVAHTDSKHFRYVGNYELPSAASAVTFESVTCLNGGGSCDVVLKELIIRSNTTAFEQQIDARVTSLNQFTSLLPKTHRHRFAASGTTGFIVSGGQKPVEGNDGLRVRAGRDNGAGISTLAFDQSLVGDFDLSATLNAAGLQTSSDGERAIRMSVQSGSDQAELVVRRTGHDAFEVSAIIEREGSDASQGETIAAETVRSIDSLRLVRIQKTMIFVYSEGGLSRVLGQADFKSAPVSKGGVRLQINAGSGDVLWKSFEAKMSSAGN